jgi:hypothetical protein
MPRRVFAVAAAAALLVFAGSSLAGDLDVKPAAGTVSGKQLIAPRVATPPVQPKMTAAGRCTSLEQQFAAAALLHLTSKKLSAARKLAEDGTEDCDHKKYSLGTRRLVAAITMLGVAPRL